VEAAKFRLQTQHEAEIIRIQRAFKDASANDMARVSELLAAAKKDVEAAQCEASKHKAEAAELRNKAQELTREGSLAGQRAKAATEQTLRKAHAAEVMALKEAAEKLRQEHRAAEEAWAVRSGSVADAAARDAAVLVKARLDGLEADLRNRHAAEVRAIMDAQCAQKKEHETVLAGLEADMAALQVCA